MKRRRFFLLFTLFLFKTPAPGAQTATSMPTGEYYLEGVHEMASGFRINADSSFDFFFIYGAVDRFGKGRWKQNGDVLTLDSPPKSAPDFVLKTSQSTNEPSLVIQISDPNTQILGYVLCMVETMAGDTLRGESDSGGRIVFDTKAPAKNIGLLHELWPNQPCMTPVDSAADNYFEFTISPSIMEVSIEHLELKFEKDGLRGGHPLMEPGREFFYRRAE